MNRNKSYKIIIITAIFIQVVSELKAQNTELINNGSLSGILTDAIPPNGWDNCNDPNNTPNVYDVYIFGNNSSIIRPVNDSSFVCMRARGVNYSETFYPPLTHEYLSQNLKSKIQKYSCYKFSAYLCTDLHMTVSDTYLSNVSFPLVLKVWGGSYTCMREKLLLVTKPIKDTTWSKKEYYFSTKDTAYSSILVEVMWDTISKGQPKNAYNGLMLMDSLSIVTMGNSDTIYADTVYFKGDGKTKLVASKGTSYLWTQTDNLTNDYSQSSTMLTYAKRDTVYIGHTDKCSTMEIFNIKLICDSLYPDETIKTYYYKYFKRVVLNASNGVVFDWQPRVNLSAYNVQSPFLTGFQDKFTVTIKDKYSCVTTEEFNIFANCDSLYPGSDVVVLDTFFSREVEILLIPKVGKIEGLWNPNRWLSCIDCQTPLATPQYSTTYSIYLVDSFKCHHREIFKIGIQLYVPNVITPNGDGYNDCFKIIGIPDNTIVRIYNKSGLNVFSANNYSDSNCWQGRDNNGINLETGTYWYFLDNPETSFSKKGFVFLKR